VAVKALSLRRMAGWKALELFEREAATLKGLTHPSVPRCAAPEHLCSFPPGCHGLSGYSPSITMHALPRCRSALPPVCAPASRGLLCCHRMCRQDGPCRGRRVTGEEPGARRRYVDYFELDGERDRGFFLVQARATLAHGRAGPLTVAVCQQGMQRPGKCLGIRPAPIWKLTSSALSCTASSHDRCWSFVEVKQDYSLMS